MTGTTNSKMTVIRARNVVERGESHFAEGVE